LAAGLITMPAGLPPQAAAGHDLSVDPRLLFAGEATASRRLGTASGMIAGGY
jgi:hypothetical protein